MNPYQRIECIGQVGHIDTPEKFRQLTDGLDLSGKNVIDVGCNLGAMCDLAYQAGAAYVLGIDEDREFIRQAQELFPGGLFTQRTAQRMTGTWDMIIMSAVFHYFRDPEGVLEQAARCLAPDGVLTLDVWIDGYDRNSEPAMLLSERGLWIPNELGFLAMAEKFFRQIECRGPALSPDDSPRYIYHLREPHVDPARSVLIYGPGGAGKTTLASTYLGYDHMQTDEAFIGWRIANQGNIMSVAWHADVAFGNNPEARTYLANLMEFIENWLQKRVNLNVVLEGYDFMYPFPRDRALAQLKFYGWNDTRVIELRARNGL